MNIRKIQEFVHSHLTENRRVVCFDKNTGYTLELITEKNPDGSLYLKEIGNHKRKTLTVVCDFDKMELRNSEKIRKQG